MHLLPPMGAQAQAAFSSLMPMGPLPPLKDLFDFELAASLLAPHMLGGGAPATSGVCIGDGPPDGGKRSHSGRFALKAIISRLCPLVKDYWFELERHSANPRRFGPQEFSRPDI